MKTEPAEPATYGKNVAATLLAAGKPEAPALLFGSEVITYRELRERVDRFAAALKARPSHPGKRVVVVMDNSPLLVAAYLGTIQAGMCAVPIPPSFSGDSLVGILHHFEAEVAVLGGRAATRLAPFVVKAGLEAWLESDLDVDGGQSVERVLAAADPAAGGPVAVDSDNDLAEILLTSGSTDAPKGVMITHRNIACNTADIIAYLGLDATDRAMVVLPFYYCFGLSVLHSHLLAGGAVALNNGFMFPERVLDDMEAKGCTNFSGVPSTYQVLTRNSHFLRRRFPELRMLCQAGGKLPNPNIQEIRHAFPDVRFFVMYGQTEATARLSYLPPEDLDSRPGSIGRGLPSTRLHVERADGARVRPGSDEVGEIVAEGDNIARGYWRDEAETARYFRGGRLHTGDIARVDDDGFLYIVDRERDFLKCMGHRVATQEIENVIAELSAVVEVAACGAPHELTGEAVHAFVIPTARDALTADAIRRHCLERLPNYKVPDRVHFVRAFPRTHNGKVRKAELRQWAARAAREAGSDRTGETA